MTAPALRAGCTGQARGQPGLRSPRRARGTGQGAQEQSRGHPRLWRLHVFRRPLLGAPWSAVGHAGHVRAAPGHSHPAVASLRRGLANDAGRHLHRGMRAGRPRARLHVVSPRDRPAQREMWDWMHGPLRAFVYTTRFWPAPAQRPTPPELSAGPLLVGPVRVLQNRVRPDLCTIDTRVTGVRDLAGEECYPGYSTATRELVTFRRGRPTPSLPG